LPPLPNNGACFLVNDLQSTTVGILGYATGTTNTGEALHAVPQAPGGAIRPVPFWASGNQDKFGNSS